VRLNFYDRPAGPVKQKHDWDSSRSTDVQGEGKMNNSRSELPMLADSAAIYGGGDSVTGPFCIVIAILIFVAQPVAAG
jgi:hypothetical protein